jgi:hypothetical protein
MTTEHERMKANLEHARRLQEEMQRKQMLDKEQARRIKENLDRAANNIRKKER